MRYRTIDHTADCGIQVYGKNRNRLFENAAYALFDLLTDIDRIEVTGERAIRVCGEDRPDLMVNWLRELLSLWTVEDMLVKNVHIEDMTDHRIRATAQGEPYDPDRHVINEEIKAVTYHQIDVHKGAAGWEATVIFDI